MESEAESDQPMRIQSSLNGAMQDLMRFRGAMTRMCGSRIEYREGSTMAEKSRGTALTIFALLFVLLAISDFAKPLSHDPGVGFVYMGHRLSGTANAVMGPLFGVQLLIFAYGIWTMRRYALPVAYIFTGWVILNMVLFSKIYGNVEHTPLYMVIITTAIGIGVPLATAITLSRRQAELA